jgi:signal transduction histidine kinase
VEAEVSGSSTGEGAATRPRARSVEQPEDFLALHRLVTGSVTERLDVDQCLSTVARAACELLDAEVGTAFLLGPAGDRLELHAVHGQRSAHWRPGLELSIDLTLNGAAVRTGRIQRTDDVRTPPPHWPAVRDLVLDEPLRSMVVAPLTSGGRCLGTVTVYRREVRPFDDRAVFELQLLADHAGLILDHALQRRELEHARRRLEEAHERSVEALQAVSLHVASTSDLPTFFGRLTETVAGLVQAEHAMFAMLADGMLAGQPKAFGLDDAVLAAQSIPCAPEGTGLVEDVVHRGRTARLRRGDPEVAAYEAQADALGMQSILAVPWCAGDRPLGAMSALNSTRPGGFSEEDGLVLRIAATAAGLVWQQRQAEEALARAVRQADDANRAKSEFVSFVAHELRGPLTVIAGQVDMLVRGDFGPVPEAPLRVLEERGRAMGRLVEDLLVTARLEAGRMAPMISVVDLCEAAGEAAERARTRARQHGGRVGCDLPAHPVRAWADGHHVALILDNLVGNALLHGGSEVCLEVTGTAEPTIRVRDDGPGIAATAQERLFERFYRVNEHMAPPGTGLGLSISRQLARQLGGDVLLESSAPGTGTVFALRLPAAEA